MYNLRRIDPRLAGYIYRRKVRCGKPNCRCATAPKSRHTAYYLQFTDQNGKQRSEYVPKSKVRALRQRIRRAKARDREVRALYVACLKRCDAMVKAFKEDGIETQGSLKVWAESSLTCLLLSKLSLHSDLRYLSFSQLMTLSWAVLDVFLALIDDGSGLWRLPPRKTHGGKPSLFSSAWGGDRAKADLTPKIC